MPLLKTEAAKLSEEDLIRGVIEEIITVDEMFAMLPFMLTAGKAYTYSREKTLAGGSWLDPNDPVTESASEFDEVTTNLRILIGDVDVDKFLDGTQSDANPQKAIQIAAKAKGMARQFQQALITGLQANKEFDGIDSLVVPSQEIQTAANGSPLSMSMLDELVDAVSTGADAIIMRKGTFRAYKALLRAAGGNTGDLLQLKNFGIAVPHHDGTPILINDFIPGDVTRGATDDTTSVFAVKFDEAVGLHGLFGGADSAGFVYEPIGTVQNKDATRERLKWYCGLALKSTKSLAAIRGVTNV